MHPSDPDTTHAAAPGAIFVRDSGAPCPDPDDCELTLIGAEDYPGHQTLFTDPPPPQSAAEAGRHCLNLIESALPEDIAADVWAAVEALENAARLEAREACANVADDQGAHHIARAIRALPLGVPR